MLRMVLSIGGWSLPGLCACGTSASVSGWTVSEEELPTAPVVPVEALVTAIGEESAVPEQSEQVMAIEQVVASSQPITDAMLLDLEGMFGEESQKRSPLDEASGNGLESGACSVDFLAKPIGELSTPESSGFGDNSGSSSGQKRSLPDPIPRRLLLRPKSVHYAYPALIPEPLDGEFPWQDEFLRVTEPARRSTFSRGFSRKILHACLFAGALSESPGFEVSL